MAFRISPLLAVACLTLPAFAYADTYSITVPTPPAPTPPSAFHLGTPTGPDAPTLTVNSQSLLSNGSPLLPVMGEFHYSRVAPADWHDELLKMKAGGVTLVSTYVFWNHHEELENQWNWSGQRDLRQFLQTCKSVHLPIIVRLGPWCHGEVRNGGIPDWLLAKKIKLRSEDPAFLHEVEILYRQIATQMEGLLYKDGGPVIGVQLDNEYHGHASYLLALKKIARNLGIDTPLYTRTGWPNLTTPMPFGEILPLYGAYAEGFWDRDLTPMPNAYWQAFTFASERTDTAVGTDVLGNRARTDEANANQYPYLTCELGGGMETSYHRRIHVDPRDAFALEIAKLGSGSNLPGFYMYHGGTNPDSLTSSTPTTYLNENQATQSTNYNDMPDKSYDFLAPLGQYGQIREPYHLLRRTHMFLHDWQSTLAPMPPTFPDIKITKSDNTDLRYAVRSDGKSGFLFINNYQRGLDMPAKQNAQFDLKLADTPFHFPALTVPANTAFLLPFNLDLHGVTLLSATAQPVCQITDGDTTTILFAEIPGLPAEFSFPNGTQIDSPVNTVHRTPDAVVFSNIATSLNPAITLHAGGHTTHILLVDHDTSLRVWRATLAGKERLLITPPNETLFTDDAVLTLQTTDPALTAFGLTSIPPLPPTVSFPQPAPPQPLPALSIQQTQQPGELRKIPIGVHKAATEPSDADFAGTQPAVYELQLPPDTDPKRRLLLRLHYTGDVARLYLGDKFLTDNFYNGTPFDLDLTPLAPDLYAGKQKLTLKILPLQKDAPIYIQKEDQPDFGNQTSLATLRAAELIETRSLTLKP